MYCPPPQLLGHDFQKARNFTASSHQNAGFSISSFKKISGGDNPETSQREEATPSRTQHPAQLNFSAMVAPLAPVVIHLVQWFKDKNALQEF